MERWIKWDFPWSHKELAEKKDNPENRIDKHKLTWNHAAVHNDTNEIPFYKIISESGTSEEDYKKANTDGSTNRNEDLNTNTNLLEEVKHIIERIDPINKSNKDDDEEEEEYDYKHALNDYEEIKAIKKGNRSSGTGRYKCENMYYVL